YPRFRCLRVLSSLFLLPPTPPPAIYTLSLHDALPIYLFQTEFIGPVPNGGNFIGNRTTLLHIHHLEQPHKHDTAFAQRVTESRMFPVRLVPMELSLLDKEVSVRIPTRHFDAIHTVHRPFARRLHRQPPAIEDAGAKPIELPMSL